MESQGAYRRLRTHWLRKRLRPRIHSSLYNSHRYHKQWKLEVLGLPFQQYYVRPPLREKKKKRAWSEDLIETDLWRNVIKEKALPAVSNVIRVCDRAADIYEVFCENKRIWL